MTPDETRTTAFSRGRFALGATGYASQRLHGPEDENGTLLLKALAASTAGSLPDDA